MALLDKIITAVTMALIAEAIDTAQKLRAMDILLRPHRIISNILIVPGIGAAGAIGVP